MFSMGLIAQEVFQRLQDDAELDSLFTDVTRAEKFLQMLTSQEQLRFKKRFTEILFHWWNNVLGFHRLDIEAGTIMKQASAGAGEIVYKANAAAITDAVRGNSTVNPGIFIPDPTGEEDPFIDNGGRRVPVSCHVAQPWDPAGGTDPRRFEGGDESPDEGLQDQHWPDESEDESTKPEESMD
jgi:hypothetical protein